MNYESSAASLSYKAPINVTFTTVGNIIVLNIFYLKDIYENYTIIEKYAEII